MYNRFGAIIHQVGTVVKGINFYVAGQYVIVQVFNLVLYQFQYNARVFTFAHYNNTFNNIMLVIPCNLPQPWLARFCNFSNIAYQYRQAIHFGDYDVLYFLNVVQQANAAYYVRLSIFLYYIAAHIHIAFFNSIVNVKGC